MILNTCQIEGLFSQVLVGGVGAVLSGCSPCTCKIHISNLYKLLEKFKVLFFRLLVIQCVSLSLAQPYIPGTPGGPWTQREMLIVKSKLYSTFSSNGGSWALEQVYPNASSICPGWSRWPEAPKMLRLGFHDCLK